MISVKIYKIFYKIFLNLRDNVLFVNNLDLLNDNFMRKFHGLWLINDHPYVRWHLHPLHTAGSNKSYRSTEHPILLFVVVHGYIYIYIYTRISKCDISKLKLSFPISTSESFMCDRSMMTLYMSTDPHMLTRPRNLTIDMSHDTTYQPLWLMGVARASSFISCFSFISLRICLLICNDR